MSSEDKIGEKLVESVKKSKTGAVANKTSARTSPDAREILNRAQAETAKPAEKTTENTIPYFNNGPRVWPD